MFNSMLILFQNYNLVQFAMILKFNYKTKSRCFFAFERLYSVDFQFEFS